MLPTVTQQALCHLPADSDNDIGFGPTDEFLVGRRNNNTITKYQCSADSVLTTVWEKPAPAGMGYNCYKYITGPSGEIVLHAWSSSFTTGIYSSNLILKADHAAHGLLYAVTSSRLLYIGMDGEWVVDIYNLQGDTRMHRLAPPPGTVWSYALSVVVVHDSGNVMVVDGTSKTLDVFSATGTIIIHTH